MGEMHMYFIDLSAAVLISQFSFLEKPASFQMQEAVTDIL